MVMNYNKLELKHYIIEIPKISARQYLLLRHILMTIEASSMENQRYFIDFDLFSDMSNEETKMLLKSNLEITITNKKDNTWQNFHIINEVSIEDKKIFFRPATKIRENIVTNNFSEMYTFFYYILFNGIRHKQTLLFLDYILNKKNIKFDLTPKQLKEIMEIEEDQYVSFSSFKRFILDRAISEINGKTTYNVSYSIGKKTGKKISLLSFTYQTK